GSQAHIVVEPQPLVPRPLLESGARIARRIERSEPRYRPFQHWQRDTQRIERVPGVVAVSPKVTGSVMAVRGDLEMGAVLLGADPGRLRRIVDLPSHMVSGAYRLSGDDVLTGSELADELGLRVGSPL